MTAMIEVIPEGTITSVPGFQAGATYAGLKTYSIDKLDLGILFSEHPCTSAGTFSTNKIVSPSVTLTKRHISMGPLRALVANSGCANACVGEQGLKDAQEVAELAAAFVGVQTNETAICSTGMIGVELPLALIRRNIGNIHLSNDGGHSLARAIMTTDSHPKEMAISVEINGKKVTIGGIAKGSGMIHPNMATMLSFISTDAAVENKFLQKALCEAVDTSFNMIDVDGDQSTNDSVIVMANGATDCEPIKDGTKAAKIFQESLTYLCVGLAKDLARDGEGATKLIEVTVEGALNIKEARLAAREVAGSILVKSAVHGNDPNWGRVAMALGKSGVNLEEPKIALYINDICILEHGQPIPYLKEAVIASMNTDEVSFRIHLNIGDSTATAWGCDLTEDYVTFNSAYTS